MDTEEIVKSAKKAFSSKDYKTCILLLEDVIQREPDNFTVVLYLAASHAFDGDPLKAVDGFKKALSTKPDNMMALQGMVALFEKRALCDFEEVLPSICMLLKIIYKEPVKCTAILDKLLKTIESFSRVDWALELGKRTELCLSGASFELTCSKVNEFLWGYLTKQGHFPEELEDAIIEQLGKQPSSMSAKQAQTMLTFLIEKLLAGKVFSCTSSVLKIVEDLSPSSILLPTYDAVQSFREGNFEKTKLMLGKGSFNSSISNQMVRMYLWAELFIQEGNAADTEQKLLSLPSSAHSLRSTPRVLLPRLMFLRLLCLKSQGKYSQVIQEVEDDPSGNLEQQLLRLECQHLSKSKMDIHTIELLLRLHPNNARLLFFKGLGLVRSGDPAAAVEVLLSAIKLDPASTDILMLTAKVYLRQQRWAEVYKHLLMVLKADQRQSKAFLLIGEYMLLSRKDSGMAVKFYEKAADVASNQNNKILFKVLQRLLSLNEKTSASAVLTQYLANLSQRTESQLRTLGLLFLNCQLYSDAVKCFEVYLVTVPDDGLVVECLGDAFLGRASYGSAVRAYLKSINIRESQDTTYAKCRVAEILYLEKEYEDAATLFRKILQVHPDYKLALVGLSKTEFSRAKQFYARGMLCSCRLSLTAALESASSLFFTEPHTVHWTKLVADILFWYTLVLPSGKGLEVSPSLHHLFPTPVVDKETMLIQILSMYSTMLAGPAQTVSHYNEVALVSLELFKLTKKEVYSEQAVQSAMKATKLEPSCPAWWTTLAVVFAIAESRMDLSQSCLKIALKLDAKSAITWTQLAVVFLIQGCSKDAEEALNTAQVLDPYYQDLWVARALNVLKNGNSGAVVDKAAKYFLHAIQMGYSLEAIEGCLSLLGISLSAIPSRDRLFSARPIGSLLHLPLCLHRPLLSLSDLVESSIGREIQAGTVNDIQVLLNYGLLLESTGFLRKALCIYKRAEELGDSSGPDHRLSLSIIRVHMFMGNFEEALALVPRIKAQFPKLSVRAWMMCNFHLGKLGPCIDACVKQTPQGLEPLQGLQQMVHAISPIVTSDLFHVLALASLRLGRLDCYQFLIGKCVPTDASIATQILLLLWDTLSFEQLYLQGKISNEFLVRFSGKRFAPQLNPQDYEMIMCLSRPLLRKRSVHVTHLWSSANAFKYPEAPRDHLLLEDDFLDILIHEGYYPGPWTTWKFGPWVLHRYLGLVLERPWDATSWLRLVPVVCFYSMFGDLDSTSKQGASSGMPQSLSLMVRSPGMIDLLTQAACRLFPVQLSRSWVVSAILSCVATHACLVNAVCDSFQAAHEGGSHFATSCWKALVADTPLRDTGTLRNLVCSSKDRPYKDQLLLINLLIRWGLLQEARQRALSLQEVTLGSGVQPNDNQRVALRLALVLCDACQPSESGLHFFSLEPLLEFERSSDVPPVLKEDISAVRKLLAVDQDHAKARSNRGHRGAP